MITFLVKSVLKSLAFVVKIVYNVIKLFHIRLFTLALLTTFAFSLFAPDILSEYSLIFGIVIVFTAILTLYGWVAPVFRSVTKQREKERDKQKLKQIENKRRGEAETELATASAPPAKPQKLQNQKPEHYPKLFAVEGRKDYIFKEWEDRYELYRIENGKHVWVRTDEKIRKEDRR